MACSCSGCQKGNPYKVGEKVKLKADKAIEPGMLPTEVTNKTAQFTILKLDQSTTDGSAFLEMSNGVGKETTIDGKKVWGWWVYHSALEEQKPVRELKAGDAVKVDKSYLPSGMSATEANAAFKVINVDNQELILEVPEGYGNPRYGKENTWNVSKPRFNLVTEYKASIGDLVRPIKDKLHMLNANITTYEQNAGFKVLQVSENTLVIEVPPGKGAKDSRWPGKTINTVKADVFESAIGFKLKVGDYVRVEEGYLSNTVGLTESQLIQSFEITNIEYSGIDVVITVKLPNGKTCVINVDNTIDKDEEDNDDAMFEIGSKVYIDPECFDELPNSLSPSQKKGKFKVKGYSSYDDVYQIEVPANCTEAELVKGIRLWYIDGDSMTDKKHTMVKNERVKDNVESDKSIKKESNMIDNNSDMSFLDRVKANGERAAYRTAGKRLTDLVKKALLKAMEAGAASSGQSREEIRSGLVMLHNFFNTEFGNAAISTALGMALAEYGDKIPFAPFQDGRADTLADELQAEGMGIVMDKVTKLALDTLLPEVDKIFNKLPGGTDEEVEEEVEVEEVPVVKKAPKKVAKKVVAKAPKKAAKKEEESLVDEILSAAPPAARAG